MENTYPEKFPFFNFSVLRILATESDPLKKARLKIAMLVMMLAAIKAVFVATVAVYMGLQLQIFRSVVLLIALLIIFKLLLWRPKLINPITHALMIGALAIVWSSLFIYVQALNIVTVQIIMICSLVSYYLIGGTMAAIYTIAGLIPLIYGMVATATLHRLGIPSQELPGWGLNVVVVLNFASFIGIHYLYYRAFTETLKEKDILNTKLQENVSTVQELADSRTFFLSTMSHELRTPLNGVIGMTNLLRDSATTSQKDHLDILEFSANNLLAVINDVLDYNKIELNRIELEKLPLNLAELLRRTASGLEIHAREKGLALILDSDELLDKRQVICDPTRLAQILYNLIGNAIKFTQKGSIRVQIRALPVDQDTIAVTFTITDTGIGIAPERMEAIFEPFVQASTTTTREYGGTGLGLAIVKKLLGLLNSNINVESKPGEGTVFRFTIDMPLVPERDQVLAQNGSEKRLLTGMRVLVAEDNRVNILLLERLLKKWDAVAMSVSNGEEAVAAMHENDFDVILMDIHMPRMDGYEATRLIRALKDPVKRNITIIALTASVSHDLAYKSKESGMQDQLSKPFQPDKLYDVLRHVLDEKIKNNATIV